MTKPANQSRFSKSVLEQLPASAFRGIQELEAGFRRMELSSLASRDSIHQIEESIGVFADILESTVCENQPHSLMNAQLDSIEEAIEFINSAINNRLQSSRYIFESKVLNRPSIGPFSQLYLFYESFVDLFERLISEYHSSIATGKSESKISFLLNVTVHSTIQASLYVPKTCEQHPSKRLIGIRLNQQSFFDIKNTIIILLHEIGHYMRPVDRIQRNKLFLQLFFNWQQDYIHLELRNFIDSIGTQRNLDLTKDQDIQSFFEDPVLSALFPIISIALETYFEDYIKSLHPQSLFPNGNAYELGLSDFVRLLEKFVHWCSDNMSLSLYTNSNARNVFKDTLKESLQSIDDWQRMYSGEADNNDSKNEPFFSYLCRTATSVINNKEVNISSEGIDYLLKCLSLLGLNEATENNLDRLTEQIIQVMKRSLDISDRRKIIEMHYSILHEALADIFVVRALNIKDYETYWEIMKPLYDGTFYSNYDKKRFFGTRNAIMEEYFNLKNGRSLSKQEEPIEYKIPLYFDQEYSGSVNIKGKTISDYELMVGNLRYSLFVPVAEFLSMDEQIYPESVFQQPVTIKANAHTDGELVNQLREKYMKMVFDSAAQTFENELELLKVFLGKGDDYGI